MKKIFNSIITRLETNNKKSRFILKIIRILVKWKIFPLKKANYLPSYGIFNIKIPGYNFSIKLESNGKDCIANDLFWKGYSSFESNTTNLFLKLVKNSKIILDIGANNGYYSLLAAKYKTDTKIFAFEPVPIIYNQFIKNISINNLKNITTF